MIEWRLLNCGPLQKALLRRSVSQARISVELRRNPLAQPFRLEHGAMRRVIVAHPEERFGKLLL